MALNLDETRRLLQEQARIGRVNVTSPGGTAQFSGPDRNQLTIAGTPAQQRIQAGQERTGERAGNLAQLLAGRLGGFGVGRKAPGVNFGALPGGGQAVQAGDLSGAGGFTGLAGAGRAEQNVFQRGSNLIEPQMEQELAQARTDLAAAGIPEQSERGRQVLDDINRRQGLARENLALSSTEAGGREASRVFGDLLGLGEQRLGQQGQRFDQQNQLRGQGLQEALLRRGIGAEDASRGLSELGSLQQLSRGGQFQPVSFGPAGIDLGAGVGGAQAAANQGPSSGQQAAQAGVGLFGDLLTSTRGFGLFDKGGVFGP